MRRSIWWAQNLEVEGLQDSSIWTRDSRKARKKEKERERERKGRLTPPPPAASLPGSTLTHHSKRAPKLLLSFFFPFFFFLCLDSAAPRAPRGFMKIALKFGGWVGGWGGLILYLGPELLRNRPIGIVWFHQIQPEGFILGVGRSI
jgi:hypothetical protein